jgi:hypothetical protein
VSTASERGREFETRWMRLLRDVEGRAHLTVASGAVFGDHDVRSSMHICQCKSTTIPKKSISIPLDDYHSVLDCAAREWRADGAGTKIGLFVNELPTGEVLVTISGNNYLDLLKEHGDLLGMCTELREQKHTMANKILGMDNTIHLLEKSIMDLREELSMAKSVEENLYDVIGDA